MLLVNPMAMQPPPLTPPDKRIVLERLIYDLASEPKPFTPAYLSPQLTFKLLAGHATNAWGAGRQMYIALGFSRP
jgi:hypothetical protein